MDLRVKNKVSNRTISMIYHHWIYEIVNKGEANNYIILEYPDLVQMEIIHPDGRREKDRILERRKAEEEIKKFPNAFDFVEIDVKELIANDIKRSNKNQSSSESSSSSEPLNKSGNTQKRNKRVPIIGAIKQAINSLSPIWKFILSIIAMVIASFLAYLLIEWYKSLSYV